ncbi:hypothetical protein KM043_000624 [Ampulex compressa]|nr:hypothetical protein KM043_000624 [Ampulex compressa]
MQRVLSFQMARGFEESSEFVTKRMCFSFAFSISFFALLCGFLLGRFSAQRTIEFRADRRRLEFAGNGLESREYLRDIFVRHLEEATFEQDGIVAGGKVDKQCVRETFGNLSLVNEVTDNGSSLVSFVRGAREPDRYVVLSIDEESAGIALELAKELNGIHVDQEWRPRRSLVFCVFFGRFDVCADALPSFLRSRVIAYVALYATATPGDRYLAISGSEIMRSIVSEILGHVRHFNTKLSISEEISTKLDVSQWVFDMPRVMLTYVNKNVTRYERDDDENKHGIMLAKIIGKSVWTLSESFILKWDSKYLNVSALKALEVLNNTSSVVIADIHGTVKSILNYAMVLSYKAENMECTNELEIRRFNDLIMDLDRRLSCYDPKYLFTTDRRTSPIPNESSNDGISMVLEKTLKCYKDVLQILHYLQK